jgi:hypothetical protein
MQRLPQSLCRSPSFECFILHRGFYQAAIAAGTRHYWLVGMLLYISIECYCLNAVACFIFHAVPIFYRTAIAAATIVHFTIVLNALHRITLTNRQLLLLAYATAAIVGQLSILVLNAFILHYYYYRTAICCCHYRAFHYRFSEVVQHHCCCGAAVAAGSRYSRYRCAVNYRLDALFCTTSAIEQLLLLMHVVQLSTLRSSYSCCWRYALLPLSCS